MTSTTLYARCGPVKRPESVGDVRLDESACPRWSSWSPQERRASPRRAARYAPSSASATCQRAQRNGELPAVLPTAATRRSRAPREATRGTRPFPASTPRGGRTAIVSLDQALSRPRAVIVERRGACAMIHCHCASFHQGGHAPSWLALSHTRAATRRSSSGPYQHPLAVPAAAASAKTEITLVARSCVPRFGDSARKPGQIAASSIASQNDCEV